MSIFPILILQQRLILICYCERDTVNVYAQTRKINRSSRKKIWKNIVIWMCMCMCVCVCMKKSKKTIKSDKLEREREWELESRNKTHIFLCKPLVKKNCDWLNCQLIWAINSFCPIPVCYWIFKEKKSELQFCPFGWGPPSKLELQKLHLKKINIAQAEHWLSTSWLSSDCLFN